MMDVEDRRLLMTVAWMCALHGQEVRARTMCRALVEDDPSDGVVAAVYADLLLTDEQPQQALDVLRLATFGPKLDRAAAMLEGRALAALGRRAEAERRWRRYVDKVRGVERTWVAG